MGGRDRSESWGSAADPELAVRRKEIKANHKSITMKVEPASESRAAPRSTVRCDAAEGVRSKVAGAKGGMSCESWLAAMACSVRIV